VLYFFHVLRPNAEPILDEEGAELENFEIARQEALDSLRELAVEALKKGRYAHGLAIQIIDEDGAALDTLRADETFA